MSESAYQALALRFCSAFYFALNDSLRFQQMPRLFNFRHQQFFIRQRHAKERADHGIQRRPAHFRHREIEDKQVVILLQHQLERVFRARRRIDHTNFFQVQYGQRKNEKRIKYCSLHPLESQFRKSVNRFVLKDNIKLKIYYTTPVVETIE